MASIVTTEANGVLFAEEMAVNVRGISKIVVVARTIDGTGARYQGVAILFRDTPRGSFTEITVKAYVII